MMCASRQAIVVTGAGTGAGDAKSTVHFPEPAEIGAADVLCGRILQQPRTGSQKYSSSVRPSSRGRRFFRQYQSNCSASRSATLVSPWASLASRAIASAASPEGSEESTRIAALPSIQVGPERTVLPSIPGQPPRLDALPPGCPFTPRCPYARGACDDVDMLPIDTGHGHETACPFAAAGELEVA